MPRFDGTGPQGGGPMTGRGRGFCTPGERAYGSYRGGVPTFLGPTYGPSFGRARGFGGGRGYGRGSGYGMGRGRGFSRGYGFSRGRGW